MKEFQGKTAVVTGGASGIGRALAERFASERMNVVLADIEEDALAKAVHEMEGQQHSVAGVVTDTMRRESISNLLQETTERFGNVHILCNNAGVGSPRPVPIWEVPDEDWNWVMGVNFYGVLYGIQTFVPHMLEHGEPSHIVNTASIAGLMPAGGIYGITKHSVLSLTETLWSQLKESNANISASVLCPGFVNTNIHDSGRNRPQGYGSLQVSNEAKTALKSRLENGKEPTEIADIVFQSIEEDCLYVLPHPAWDDVLVNRVKAVVARGGLMRFDPAIIDRPRADGEKY